MSARSRIKNDEFRIFADDMMDDRMKSEGGRVHLRAEFQEMNSKSSMIALLESTLHLPGDVIECGVFRGISLKQIGFVLSDNAPQKRLFGLDSFQGFPAERVGRVDLGFLRFLSSIRRKFRVCDDVPSRLQKFFDCYGIQGRTVPGYFHETLGQFKNHSFCFIHLDCDIYDSYKVCLDSLYDLLVPGGVMVFDDYRSPNWPGAEKAVNEFFAGKPENISQSSQRAEKSWFIRKCEQKLARAAA